MGKVKICVCEDFPLVFCQIEVNLTNMHPWAVCFLSHVSSASVIHACGCPRGTLLLTHKWYLRE